VASEPAWPCDSCGRAVRPGFAFAPMETLELPCAERIAARLKPCEECGRESEPSRTSTFRPVGVICESGVVSVVRRKQVSEPPI
jgi:hypothetical protein